jgi:hypothetical protein
MTHSRNPSFRCLFRCLFYETIVPPLLLCCVMKISQQAFLLALLQVRFPLVGIPHIRYRNTIHWLGICPVADWMFLAPLIGDDFCWQILLTSFFSGKLQWFYSIWKERPQRRLTLGNCVAVLFTKSYERKRSSWRTPLLAKVVAPTGFYKKQLRCVLGW